jgi:hypothetical protein
MVMVLSSVLNASTTMLHSGTIKPGFDSGPRLLKGAVAQQPGSADRAIAGQRSENENGHTLIAPALIQINRFEAE